MAGYQRPKHSPPNTHTTAIPVCELMPEPAQPFVLVWPKHSRTSSCYVTGVPTRNHSNNTDNTAPLFIRVHWVHLHHQHLGGLQSTMTGQKQVWGLNLYLCRNRTDEPLLHIFKFRHYISVTCKNRMQWFVYWSAQKTFINPVTWIKTGLAGILWLTLRSLLLCQGRFKRTDCLTT